MISLGSSFTMIYYVRPQHNLKASVGDFVAFAAVVVGAFVGIGLHATVSTDLTARISDLFLT